MLLVFISPLNYDNNEGALPLYSRINLRCKYLVVTSKAFPKMTKVELHRLALTISTNFELSYFVDFLKREELPSSMRVQQ